MSNNIQNLVQDINAGHFDESLEQIIDICRDRIKASRKAEAASLTPGDRVRIVDLRPKYLTKITGATLARVEGDKAVLELPDSARSNPGYMKYFGTYTTDGGGDLVLTVPVTCIKPA